LGFTQKKFFWPYLFLCILIVYLFPIKDYKDGWGKLSIWAGKFMIDSKKSL